MSISSQARPVEMRIDLYVKLQSGVTWDELNVNQRWMMNSLNSSDYLYDTKCIRFNYEDRRYYARDNNHLWYQLHIRQDQIAEWQQAQVTAR